MAHYPTQKDITLWIPSAVEVFQSVMPPIDKPFPRVYIATAKTFPTMRAELIEKTGVCIHIPKKPKLLLWSTYMEIKATPF